MTDNMGSMGDVAKYGGTAQITDEDMRRRNEDNAKATAEVAEWARGLTGLMDESAVRKAIGLPIYGRISDSNPDPRTQAILRHNTTCTTCGQRIKAGDEIVITFATAPAEGTFRHADCEPTNG